MTKTITSEKLPILLWLDNAEEGALEQAKNLANFPFAFKHIAIMPDTHMGIGMPIGGVIATKDVIIPSAVGVDIGCGMVATRLSLNEKQLEQKVLKEILGEIRQVIPVGFKHHDKEQDEALMPKFKQPSDILSDYPVVSVEYGNALTQIGTLGGGNHFIEIQKDQDGFIWIMIHSGSRNIGFTVANNYERWAAEECEKRGEQDLVKNRLCYFQADSELGQKYINEMNYCLEFAFANRQLMLDKIKTIFSKHFNDLWFAPMINIAHNYARLEKHFDEEVWVHRKGATSANRSEIGIIPGSQGSHSYIVQGKGNPDSFKSCSHGAGRLMSRTKAQKELIVETEIAKLDQLGVLHALRGAKDLDEAPGAYKPIQEVMDNQLDLVEILVELTPLGVIKG